MLCTKNLKLQTMWKRTKKNKGEVEDMESSSMLMLEYDAKQSDHDSFVLVKSRKKGVRRKSTHSEELRRSKRTTPSEYRNKGQQENPEPLKPERKVKKIRKVLLNDRSFLEL